MSTEIPLLRESRTFSRRLREAADRRNEHAALRHRRVNWSWRYGAQFYAREAAHFAADPDRYVRGEIDSADELEDVFALKLRSREVLTVVAKACAHTLFAILGIVQGAARRVPPGTIWRKCYVDDIELVFDEAQPGVVRAVFPFPISLARQWRYLRYLRQQRHRFVLDGNRYAIGDLARFLWKRDVRSLERLETRSELRRARILARSAPALVQLSDEFNIGSLAFARLLFRAGVVTVNVAHGVGKYFPVHAYRQFELLTERQHAYYEATVPCHYGFHSLSDSFGVTAGDAVAAETGGVVLLSQDFGEPGTPIARAEQTVASALRAIAADASSIRLYFKPHPNNREPLIPSGFTPVSTIAEIDRLRDPVLLSLFSTTHVDPRFRGRKFLVRCELIRPEIAFDDDGSIVDVAALTNVVRSAA